MLLVDLGFRGVESDLGWVYETVKHILMLMQESCWEI